MFSVEKFLNLAMEEENDEKKKIDSTFLALLLILGNILPSMVLQIP